MPNPLISTLIPFFSAFEMSLKKISTKASISDWLSCEFFSLSCFMSFGSDNYFSFLPFLPIAFSNIPLRVAPDFVAPSPNLAIRDFSSSI